MPLKLLSLLFLITNLNANDCALFRQFPAAKSNLNYQAFCDLPTPITQLKNLGQTIGYPNVYLKRDDLSGKRLVQIDEQCQHNDLARVTKLYGGNKGRKLEWLIADALKQGAHTIMTYGCAGSNHALATCMYAKEFGLKTILMLIPQPNTNVARQNLMHNLHLGAEIYHCTDHTSRNFAAQQILATDPGIYFIPIGGSNAIGTIGYVNAAFELYEQIENQTITVPDLIYVPMGSLGTTTGLLLGLALKKSPIKIVAVATEPEKAPAHFRDSIKNLFIQTNQLLHSKDPAIMLVEFPEQQLVINYQFASNKYGEWTHQDCTTIKLFHDLEQINLEGTYSAKPVSAFMYDVATKQLTNETVLIWETHCGLDFDQEILKQHSYTELPAAFHHYFESQ